MSLGGLVGAGIGFFVGGPSGALTGYSLGSTAEALLNPKTIEGPRLDDLKTQLSTYGAPIPFEYGSNRHAGTVIWPKELVAVETKNTQSSSKGGPEQTTYSYSLSCAVLVCEGPIAGIRRMWANKKLVYDASVANTGPTKDPAMPTVRIYLGTESQAADPLITATDGPSPAYLGYAYVVFENYDVTELGGRAPQWEFEVLKGATTLIPPPINLGAGGVTAYADDTIWTATQTNLYKYSAVTGLLLATVVLPASASSITIANGTLWIGHSDNGVGAGTCATPVDMVTLAVGASIDFGYNGAVGFLATVVAIPYITTGEIYGFFNNGVGSGGFIYPSNTTSGITVPNWIYKSLEMPLISKIALTGYGRFMVIANTLSDSNLATITNSAWGTTVQNHHHVYDSSRNCIYWLESTSANVYKVDLTSYELTLLITASNVYGIHYNRASDLIYVDSGSALTAYSPATGAVVQTLTGSGVLASGNQSKSIDVGSSAYYFLGQSGVPGKLWKIPLNPGLVPTQVMLGDIVSDLCVRSGLQTTDINVTALTDMVDGYIVPRQMTARAAIEPLQQAYYFDAVEGDDKIKFVKRGGALAATIPLIERSVRETGQEPNDSLSINRAFEFELPVECDVEYPDVAADYLVGNQYERRITKDTRQKINLQSPVVMSASKAKQIARVTLYEAWLNQSYRWTTSRAYAHLEPTDVVALPTANASYAARITNKTEQPNGVIEWQGQMEDANAYQQDGAGSAAMGYLPQTIFVPLPTVLVLLDVPLMRDEDDNAGYYVAMGGVL